MFYVYFAKSISNGKVYVGRTENEPQERVAQHNNGSNTWTKQNGPFKLIYFESFLCKEDAIKKESFYKTGIGKKIKGAIVKVMEL